MSRIDEMIQRLCPDGVEYRKLIECADVLYGAPFDSSFFNADGNGVPLIRIRDVKPGETSTYYSGDYEDRYLIHAGDILIGMDGEFNTAKWKSDDALLNQRVLKIVTSNDEVVDNSYLFHLLIPLMKDVEEGVTGSTVKHLSARLIKSLEIPVPPLDVQREIVRALDSFAELEAKLETELEAELKARKAQYAHYRDRLLSRESLEEMAGGEVEVYRLGDICDTLTGYPFKSAEFRDTGVLVIRGMNVKRGELDFSPENNRYWDSTDGLERYLLQTDDIVVAMDGSLVGKSLGMYKGEGAQALLGQRLTRIRCNKSVCLSNYVYHCLCNGLLVEMTEKKKTSGAVPHISLKDIQSIELPFPPLSVQQQVVDILDRFDALTTSLTDGLPAEIEARRQQYEHYRDRLLDLPRKEVAV